MMFSLKNREPAGDFEDDLALGEWIHSELRAAIGLETERWAVDRVRNTERQLQVKRAPRTRLTAEIIWVSEMTAFTAPGRYIYLSRELLQRAASDDPIAFVLAHEMAHHDLGHCELFVGGLAGLRKLPGGPGIALLLRVAQRLAFSPEMESAADAYAMDLCIRAGYDGKRCLELFDILEANALNLGDLDGVFGPDDELEAPESDVGRWLAQARAWSYKRFRGYPSIRERKAALLERLPDEVSHNKAQ